MATFSKIPTLNIDTTFGELELMDLTKQDAQLINVCLEVCAEDEMVNIFLDCEELERIRDWCNSVLKGHGR